MTDIWMMLTPRELERVCVRVPAAALGEHADLLRTIQAKIDKIRGELTLTGAEWLRVQAAARNWRLGYERAFQAITTAAARHV